MYVITSPKDISLVYKNHQTLRFEGFVKTLYASLGMSSTAIATRYQPTSSGDGLRDHIGLAVQTEQLHPGKRLEDLTAVYVRRIGQQLQWDNIPAGCVLHDSCEAKTVSLNKWVR